MKGRCQRPVYRMITLVVLVTSGAGCHFMVPVVASADKLEVRASGLDPAVSEGLLEAVREVRTSLARDFSGDPDAKLTVVVVDHTESHGLFRPAVFMVGDCVVLSRDRALGVLDDMRPLLHHEVTHFFVRNQVGEVARWYNEGLAEYLCYQRSWRKQELVDLFWHAEELDEELLVELVQSSPQEFSSLDVRGASMETRYDFGDVQLTVGSEVGSAITVKAGDWLMDLPRSDLPKAMRENPDPAGAEDLMRFVLGWLELRHPDRFVSGRVYRPLRHYSLARLVLASLDVAGWGITSADPSERILADPGVVVAHVKSYVRNLLGVMLRRLSQDRQTSPEFRRAVTGGLCKIADEGAGGVALLGSLAGDPDSGVRDRAAFVLWQRGDLSYAQWNVEIYVGLASRREVSAFFSLLDAAVAEFTGGLRDPEEVQLYLTTHLAELPPQMERH